MANPCVWSARKNMRNCELCESTYHVQRHHIVGGRGKRCQHENEYSTIFLCWHCHHGDDGCHGKNGRALTLKLKLLLQQKYFALGFVEDEVRRMMGGKLYP